jgi:hypothetical protein
MRFKLVEDVATETEERILGNSFAKQTSLKEFIVDVVNETTGNNLDDEEYAVHHLDNNHFNNSVQNVSVTTKSNHSSLTNYITNCNWEAVEECLQSCYIVKAWGQRMSDKEIRSIIHKLKTQRTKYKDSDNKYWIHTTDNVFPGGTLRKLRDKTISEIPFHTAAEFDAYRKENKLKKVK